MSEDTPTTMSADELADLFEREMQLKPTSTMMLPREQVGRMREEIERLRAEVARLTAERDAAMEREQDAWKMADAAEERCKYEARCGCMVDTPDDVCLSHSPAVTKAYERGRAEVYAQIRALPSPWDRRDDQWIWSCQWCRGRAPQGSAEPAPRHPSNGCLWAKAHATPHEGA